MPRMWVRTVSGRRPRDRRCEPCVHASWTTADGGDVTDRTKAAAPGPRGRAGRCRRARTRCGPGPSRSRERRPSTLPRALAGILASGHSTRPELTPSRHARIPVESTRRVGRARDAQERERDETDADPHDIADPAHEAEADTHRAAEAEGGERRGVTALERAEAAGNHERR